MSQLRLDTRRSDMRTSFTPRADPERLAIALLDLLVADMSGDTGRPALVRWVGMLPCAAGALFVALLWRQP